jgi:hypothetical protein
MVGIILTARIILPTRGKRSVIHIASTPIESAVVSHKTLALFIPETSLFARHTIFHIWIGMVQ